MKTIYIADDGKQFDNSGECKIYEEKLIIKELEEKSQEKLKTIDINYDGKNAKILCIEKGEQFPYLELLMNKMAIFYYTYSIRSIINELWTYFIKNGRQKIFIIVWYDDNYDGCPIKYELAKNAIEDCKYEIKNETIIMNSIIDAIKELGGEVNE